MARKAGKASGRAVGGARRPTGRKKAGGSRREKADAGARPDGAPAGGELVGMDQAIELLKTTRPTFYRWLRAGKIKGMKLGRQWRFYKDDVERFLRGEAPRVDLPADITPLVELLRAKAREFGVTPARPDGLSDPPAGGELEEFARLTFLVSVAMGASDIHVTAHLVEGETSPVAALRYRVDGVLYPAATIDIRLLPAIVEQFKRMAACDVNERRRSQDGRIMISLPEVRGGDERPVDVRVNFLPAAVGETVTMRVLDPGAVRLDLARIGHSPRDRERIERAIRAPWGLFMITGPTGTGKTTTLYSCLNELSSPGVKIVTVEDPVEFLLPWATQVPLRLDAGVTFPSTLRAMLRSAPDVILVGEVRDVESLWLVLQAALTGHVVMTNLHADESARGLVRMVEMGANPFVVGDATRLVMSQRLVRKLCPACSVEGEPPPGELDWAAEAAAKGGLDWGPLERAFRKPVGCPRCAGTGFRGRAVVAETLEVTPEMGKALREGAGVDEVRSLAVAQGMTTMAADGVRRAAAGEIVIREVMRALGV